MPDDKDNPRGAYKKKTASDLSFYGGFTAGFIASIEGLIMFAVNKPLHKLVRDSLKPLRKATVAYVFFVLLIVLLMQEPLESIAHFITAFSRWSRLVTVAISLFLERALKANAKMFFAALKIRHEPYAAALEAVEPPKRTTRDRLLKFKRLIKIFIIRGGAATIAWALPDSKMYVTPCLKFLTLKPVLGVPVAIGLSALEALGSKAAFVGVWWDDALMAIGEALVDAEELSMDGSREFVRRLADEDTRKYFQKRYRGYLAGSGFCNSLLMQVPLLGIPVTLIAECSAACTLVEIVQRNLHKDNRRIFPAENAIAEDDTKKSN